MNGISKNSNRNVYLDVMRLMSCILVICIHVSSVDFNSFPINSYEWNVLNIINCIGVNGVGIFFMISGALFLNEEYQLSIKKLFCNKIIKLLIIYYLTLFLYNLWPFLVGWVEPIPKLIKEHLIEGVLYEQGVYHLWFIPVLIVLYLLTPVLREAFRTSKICEYYLVLFAIIGAVLPTLLMLELPGAINRFLSHYEQKLSLFMFAGYIGYFVLGHYLHSFVQELTKKKIIIVSVITLLASIFTMVTCYADSLKAGYASSLTNTPLSANVLLSSSGVYILVKHFCGNIKSEKVMKHLKTLSGLTLGVYLLHPFVLNNVPFIIKLNTVIKEELLLTIIRIVFVTVITFSVVFIIKKLVVIMKKIIKPLSVLSLCMLLLCGCGNKVDGDKAFLQGLTAYQNGEYAVAIEKMTNAIDAGLENYELGDAYSVLGHSNLDMGLYEKAFEYYEKAIEVAPDKVSYYVNIGIAYRQYGDYDTAISYYEQALKIDPEYAELNSSLGSLYVILDEPETAIPYFEKALEAEPTLAVTNGNAALAYAMIGEFEHAQELLDKAVLYGYENAPTIQETIDRLRKKTNP